MSSKSGLYGDGWDELERAVDTEKFASILPQSMRKGLTRIGQSFVRDARKAIQEKKYVENSPLTIALKRSSTPLVRDGDLIGSITAEVAPDGLTLWVGVNRTAKGKGGKVEQIAEYLHDGATIDLRKYPKVGFAVMSQLREVVEGKRAGDAAKAQEVLDKMSTGEHQAKWIIKPRPFISDVVDTTEFDEMATKEITRAIDEALGLSRQGDTV